MFEWLGELQVGSYYSEEASSGDLERRTNSVIMSNPATLLAQKMRCMSLHVPTPLQVRAHVAMRGSPIGR
jgi:hypothetical protein